MPDQTYYVCTGTCRGHVTEEEYKKGKKTCSAKGCEKHGDPLKKMKKCSKCGEFYDSDKEHSC